jgi:hypothetical protein
MKKRVLISCVLLALVMMFSCVMAFGTSAAEATVTMTAVKGGTAIENKVVTISTADELYLLRDYVAGGGETAGVTFRLEDDIVLPETTITNRVNKNNYSNSSDIGTPEKPFKGVFDGNGKTISNLILSQNLYSSQSALGAKDLEGRGVFAYISGATVKNLNVVVKEAKYALVDVGGLIGNAKNTTVSACSVSGDLTARGTAESISRVQKNAGGLVGTADACAIRFCQSSVTISGLENVGGLVGVAQNGTKIVGCDSFGSVGYKDQAKASGTPTNFGGIVGKLNASDVESCLVKAVVYAADNKDTAVAGGVAGEVVGACNVRNCVIDVTPVSVTGVSYDAVSGKKTATLLYVYSANKAKQAGVNTFDANFKIATAATVGGQKTTNLFVAFNRYAVLQKDAYGADSKAILKAISGSQKYARVAYCVEHTRPTGVSVCEETSCAQCAEPMAAAVAHERPATAKVCEDAMCKYCNKVLVKASVQHTLPTGENVFACKPGNICTVCNNAIEPTPHDANMADCENDSVCNICGETVEEKWGHMPDGKGNCAIPEKCLRCQKVITPATGLHTPNREAPDCIHDVKCTVCDRYIMKDGQPLKALGHDVSGVEATCGAAKICARCHEMLEDATWEHTVDWSAATVVREATEEHPSIVRGTCSVCGQTVEKNEKFVPEDEDDESSSSDDPTKDPDEQKGLPTGALIGIIAGGVVVVGGGAAAVVLVLKKKKKDDSAE